MNNSFLFSEKHFLGRNIYWLNIRLVLAMFCFAAYFFSHGNRGDLFLVMGFVVLATSVILTFFVHFQTTLSKESLILDGLWTSRMVKIPVTHIKGAKKVKYSKYMLNNPMYNRHMKGVIRFYTYGNYAVEIEDKEGLIYKIGSQRPDELAEKLNILISAKA
ncbi:MAG: hypothetical protein ACJATA_000567 [Sphingobacteriales bacterium]|jgi:hypothetical protein